MDVREKLVELLISTIGLTPMDAEIYANDFIAHGVTVQDWISVTEQLPGREKELEPWKTYNVVVLRSHCPTSSYDLCDAPYDEEIVTTASYDSEQKIWHLDWGAQLNALIDIEDSPLNGDYVTHWMPMPQPPKGE